MKRLVSFKEGVWSEEVPYKVSEEDRVLLSDLSTDRQVRQEVVERIKSERYKDAPKGYITKAEEFYNSIKPEIKEGDEYRFIHMSINFNDGKTVAFGLLNCRLNGKHIQNRF